jgi:hypothetical protein
VGGTFRVDFVLQPGGPIAGSFTAPVVSLDIMASEPLHAGFSSGVGASSVLARYVLGPGVFDAAFASAMGIPRRTGIGEMFTDTLLFAGDHSTPELIADDGATYGGVQAPAAVPETPQSVLAALGVLAILLVRFSRTSRTITNL